MKYFNSITNLEQAKLHYRKLAKQLHPDKGGSAIEFQKMQKEYRYLLNRIRQHNQAIIETKPAPESELFNELGKLAEVLIKKQVPQNYLRQKMQTTESNVKKGMFQNIIDLLNNV
jgi:curved DNA-binding protein CbpA